MDRPHKGALEGRAALITGASRGFGLEIARTFIEAGASVMLCARDADQLESAGRSLKAQAGDGQVVTWRAADVSDPSQVESVVEQSIQLLRGLHILVNNAGVYGPFGAIEDIDWSEWTRAIEINLYGSVIPMRAVLPHFRSERHGKIIQLSGGGATNPMPRISAYAASKAAIVRFAETIAEEGREIGVDVNSIAPGSLNTRLLDDVLAAGPAKVGREFFARMVRQKEEGGVPLARGAELAVFLASTASNGITGKLISALWDDWSGWPDHVDELRGSDVYTLRRIVGKDRGFDWGDK
ncbi:MAG TPA: SDR family oxidoreductase [Xanthobacteraceae bacterium]|jgi:3-oxoacyl-[acyl-carrier protein] reductase|nr:SDR family oxidoreductase [Xanthobacteraceae bacterium]